MATPALLLLTVLMWPQRPEALRVAGASNECRAARRSGAKSAVEVLRDRRAANRADGLRWGRKDRYGRHWPSSPSGVTPLPVGAR